jgi:hypothetical protein
MKNREVYRRKALDGYSLRPSERSNLLGDEIVEQFGGRVPVEGVEFWFIVQCFENIFLESFLEFGDIPTCNYSDSLCTNRPRDVNRE